MTKKMDENDKTQIVQQLQEMILHVMPEAKQINKYGGVVIERIGGQTDTQCCGIFRYTNHISLEFTQGDILADPEGVLEGIGKHRRHIKLYRVEDVEAKLCRELLKQVRDL